MNQPLQVALVDDHDMLRDALRVALEAVDGIEVSLAASSVTDFQERASGAEFDLVVADLKLGDGTGIDIARAATERFDRPVLLVTGLGDRDGVQAAVEGGCAGFVSKSASIDELVDAVRIVGAGGAVFPASLLQEVLSPPPETPNGITDRELAVLKLLARGLPAGEISEHLMVSVHTVRNHIRSILTKLQARSQLEAVVRAAEQGLIRIERKPSRCR